MTITGEWFNLGSRPIMKGGRGSVVQDVDQGDIAACAVTSCTFAANAVLNGLACNSVPSETLTSNARYKTHTIVFEAATSTEAAGVVRPCSTTNVVWKPGVNINVLAIQRVSLALEEMATCDHFVLYGNAGTCIGSIGLNAGTTNPAAYTYTTSTAALTLTAIPAGQSIYVQRRSSTCSVQGRSMLLIDYETSG